MRKKLVSIFLLLIMVISPLMLSGCFFFGFGGGGGGGGGDDGDGDYSEEEGVDTNDPTNFLNAFSTVKVVHKMDMTNMDEGSQAFIFTTQVMNQIDTLSKELLLRLCGAYGKGLTLMKGVEYGVPIGALSPQGYGEGAIEDYANGGSNPWFWAHISDVSTLDAATADQYLDLYIQADEVDGKPNYKDELVKNLYNILAGEKPSSVDSATLRNIAKKFDHVGFTDAEKTKISNFILDEVIGISVVSADVAQGNMYEYKTIVPQIVATSISRTIEGNAVYPLYVPVQFEDKTIDKYALDMFADGSPFQTDALAYSSIVLGAKANLDLSSITMNIELDNSITEAVELDVYAKYQHGGQTVRGKLTETVTVKPGYYDINNNSNDITIEFKPPSAEDFGGVAVDPSTIPDYSKGNEFYEVHNLTKLRLGLFSNSSPVGDGVVYSTLNDLLGYRNRFEIHEENEVANVEYVDNSTSYIQIFFKFKGENSNIKFKIGFMDMKVEPVL